MYLQSETVQLLRSDPSSSEEEHFRTMLAQTEVERVKFVVRSYLRTRLFKVSKVSVPCCIAHPANNYRYRLKSLLDI